MEVLLPIGSVVLLKNAEKKLMIYGIMQVHAETKLQYDYIGCLYPEGNISPDFTYLFNHGEIEEILFLGFINAEQQIFRTKLESINTDKLL